MSDGATPGLGDVLGDSGALPQIVLGKKTWTIGVPTQRAKAALEELVVADAVAEVTALKEILPPNSYKEMRDSLKEAIAAKHYRTWGPGWLEGISGLDGDVKFLASLLRERHDEATVEDAKLLIDAKPDDVSLALARVIPSFLTYLAGSLPIPPQKQAELVASMSEKFLARIARLLPESATPTTPIASA